MASSKNKHSRTPKRSKPKSTFETTSKHAEKKLRHKQKRSHKHKRKSRHSRSSSESSSDSGSDSESPPKSKSPKSKQYKSKRDTVTDSDSELAYVEDTGGVYIFDHLVQQRKKIKETLTPALDELAEALADLKDGRGASRVVEVGERTLKEVRKVVAFLTT